MTHKGAEATSDSVPVLVSVAIAVAATYITHTYLLNFNLRGWRCRDPLEAKNKNQGLQGSVYQIVMASFPPYLLLYSRGGGGGGVRESNWPQTQDPRLSMSCRYLFIILARLVSTTL